MEKIKFKLEIGPQKKVVCFQFDRYGSRWSGAHDMVHQGARLGSGKLYKNLGEAVDESVSAAAALVVRVQSITMDVHS